MERYCITEQLKSVYEGLQQPFAIYQFVNRRVVTIVLSDGFCELFGYDDKEQAYYDMDNVMYQDTHPDDVARVADAGFRFAEEGGSYEVIYRTRTKNFPGYKIVHALGRHVYTEDGVRLAHVWYTDEGIYTEESPVGESELKKAMNEVLHEESLVKKSSHDYLTGLPNMTYFFELAEDEKAALLKKGDQPMLLYIDFSGMKFFNAKYGFAEGDKILRAFSRLLVRAFGYENCCRIGADHFSVITRETNMEETLHGLFEEFGKLNDGKTPPVHVGIYPYRTEDVPISSACDRAKMSCAALKGIYSSTFNYYTAKLREGALWKQYVIENLDTAIRERWIQVYLQPIVRAVNEKVSDVEALSRWIDPERGILSPASFIPALEETGLIYKLDLYMVDRVLESIREQMGKGMCTLPHSINLSRSDFDACDIVEEIRRRVDDAGVSRSQISIEVTESIIGSDFDFMKKQIERFQELGFPVWMDDFGSGYSSLDVLQSIKFDLIKFDMSFLRKLDERDEAKVILTQLMRMTTSLGVDTICEGVETESQAHFLKEIGCSKLQGYYYCRPIPFEKIREMQFQGKLIECENPMESEYYESIGRANLFDLSVISDEDEKTIQNTYSTIPVAILEVKGDEIKHVRINNSYQTFVKRFFDVDLIKDKGDFEKRQVEYGQIYSSSVRQCGQNGNRLFFDEKMPDGSVAHCFVRRINVNRITGNAAVVIAVLSIKDPDDSTTYVEIAKALAADYYNIYVIDLDTNAYTEYSSRVGGEELSIIRHGEEFFESAKRETMTRIYEEDREGFLALFSKETVLRDLDTQGVFTTVYRLIDTGVPMYVNMKITRMQDSHRIILGISIIDAHMRQQEEEKRLRQETITLGRIAALSGNYINLYIVDPETEQFVMYSASKEYGRLGLAEKGEGFFSRLKKDGKEYLYPEDLERLQKVFTKENVQFEIRHNGLFIYNFRWLIEGKYVPVSLRATQVREEDGDKIVCGINRLFAKEPTTNETEVIYTHIAHALARGYTELFYVNVETDDFIEYHTDDNLGVLTEARRGRDFFEGCERDAKLFVHPDDQSKFINAMDREFLDYVLDRSPVFEMTYRRMRDGKPFYVKMNVSRTEDDRSLIVIAVSDIDELTRKRQDEERMIEERLIYARLHAITGNFICVYVVDPEVGSYREVTSIDQYEELFEQKKEGDDFFAVLGASTRMYCHPDDMDRVLPLITQENIMASINSNGIFTLGYRVVIKRRTVHVQLKAAMVEEKEGTRLIVGLIDIDVQVRQEEEFRRRLAQAQTQVNIDALTGVKNRYAYFIAEENIDHQIENHRQAPFAVVVFDVRNPESTEDSSGSGTGDQYIRSACKVICNVFKHSPVFRFGSSEFIVISQGNDYECMEELLEQMREYNEKAIQSDGALIDCGMARYEGDDCVAAVFERADRSMYENKGGNARL